MKKNILLIVLLAVSLFSLMSCSYRDRFDTMEEMKEKSKDIKGVDEFNIGDSYEKVLSKCKSIGCTIIDRLDIFNDIVPNYLYKKRHTNWNFFIAKKNGQSDYVFEFYKGKLCLILIKGDRGKIDDIVHKYGLGVNINDIYDANNLYTWRTIHNNVLDGVNFFSEQDRCYVNNILILDCITEYSDFTNAEDAILCVSHTYVKDFLNKIYAEKEKFNSTIQYSGSSTTTSSSSGQPRGHNSMDKNDKEYWESVNREKSLRESGMDKAADIERRERLKYLQGGGYHSKDGGSQVHFQGSKEQEEQLRQMDEMGW